MVSPPESVSLLTTRSSVDAVQYGEEHSGSVSRADAMGPGVTSTSDPNRPALARASDLDHSSGPASARTVAPRRPVATSTVAPGSRRSTRWSRKSRNPPSSTDAFGFGRFSLSQPRDR